jgi:hypothetical protein
MFQAFFKRKGTLIMRKSIDRTVWMWIAVVFSVACSRVHGGEQVQAEIDTFFERLSGEFNRIAASPTVRSSRAAQLDAYFLRALKRNQVINSIVRTDAKGRTITEFVRMKGANHARKVVKTEKWFSDIAKGADEFSGMVKDTGRYYLVWSRPVTGKRASGPMAGVIMAKIDLWDCFRRVSGSIETPFLVRLNTISLYSNKWKSGKDYDEYALNVPGAESVSLRVEKAAPPPPAEQPQVAPAKIEPPKPKSAFEKLSSALKDLGTRKESGKHITVLLVLAGAAGLIILILIIMFISWLKRKWVIHNINKQY